MSIQEKRTAPEITESSEDVREVRLPDDEAYEKRKRAARIFALVGIVIFVVWGASLLQRAFPHRVDLRYLYEGVPNAQQLQKVIATVRGDSGRKGSVIFFHHEPIPNAGQRYTRTQSLQLPKGTYQVNVVLRYKQGNTRTMQTQLQIREAGTYYVYLKRAR